ncbi:MAG: hypothetical protein LBJ39_05315 [Tannerellaceae bacterium]|jgi:hypothetical protein|nr:hypothetical protein [Tannerellaceae bacterium]
MENVKPNAFKQVLEPNLLLLGLFLHIFPFLQATDNLRSGDMRSIGMGGAGATTSPLLNPSLIALSGQKSVSLNYFNRYALKELATVGGSFYLPEALIPAGIDISSFGYDDYRESMFRLLIAKRLNYHWALGVSVQYAILQTVLLEESPAQLSTDVGLTFIPVDNVLIGLFIMNLPSVSLNRGAVENMMFMPWLIQAGFQWELINGLLISAALSTCEEDVASAGLGIEYKPFDDFSMRMGIKGAPMLPSFGLGYAFSDFKTDVAFVYHPVLGISTGIGISFYF